MSLSKIHKIIKKYRALHKSQSDSWDRVSKTIKDMKDYQNKSYDFQRDGNKLFDDMIKELEGQEVFEKTKKYGKDSTKTDRK